MPYANMSIAGKPTPKDVLLAQNTIAKYLHDGGWVECIISHTGGVVYRLTSIYDSLFPELTESRPTPADETPPLCPECGKRTVIQRPGSYECLSCNTNR